MEGQMEEFGFVVKQQLWYVTAVCIQCMHERTSELQRDA